MFYRYSAGAAGSITWLQRFCRADSRQRTTCLDRSHDTSHPALVSDAPVERVLELAGQTVAYVARSLGLTLTYDSETLPVLDHYLREVPRDQPEIVELVVATAGAYFGEVVRRLVGGRWEFAEEPSQWTLVLPSAISFSPATMVASVITAGQGGGDEPALEAPPRIRPHLQEALERMGQISAEEYYSLCGWLDTLEHLHEVLVSVASAALGDAPADELAGEAAEEGADGAPDEPSPDEPSLTN